MTTNRDEHGHFLPGHPDYVKAAGVKCGRPKELKALVRDALAIAQDAMPQLINDMILDAQDTNIAANVRQQCREYLIDRIYGKANQPLSGSINHTYLFVIGSGYIEGKTGILETGNNDDSAIVK